MILGLSLPAFTMLHTILSQVGIAAVVQAARTFHPEAGRAA